jgi:hypothetical protein
MPADSGRFGARSDSTWSNQTLSVVPVRRLLFDGDFGEQDKQRDFHEGVFLIEMLASLAVGRERRRRGSTDSAAQRSCGALRLAGDAVMTDTEAFCAALGKLRNPRA